MIGGGEEEAEYPVLNARSEQKDAKPPTPEATARQRDAKEKTGTDWMWQRACRPLNWHPTRVLLHRIGTEQKNAKGAKGGRVWHKTQKAQKKANAQHPAGNTQYSTPNAQGSRTEGREGEDRDRLDVAAGVSPAELAPDTGATTLESLGPGIECK